MYEPELPFLRVIWSLRKGREVGQVRAAEASSRRGSQAGCHTLLRVQDFLI